MIVGEAWGQSEWESRRPFAGQSGQELFRMLGEAWPDSFPELHHRASSAMQYGAGWVREREDWLAATGVFLTNVLALRPAGNNFLELCIPTAQIKEQFPSYELPYVERGQYLHPQYLGEIVRLFHEIEIVRPNVIVAAGAKAAWALLQTTNIGSIRGTISQSAQPSLDGTFWKILPTYHPAGVMRQWSWRPQVVVDLMKARVEGEFPEIRRPERQIITNPTLDEIRSVLPEILSSRIVACDTETTHGQISMISFAWAHNRAITIPFIDIRNFSHFWPDQASEREAWDLVAQVLESPIPKIWQNGMYDLQYILPLGIRATANLEDTMLLHHSHYPEMKKGLGFLGSIYTSEPAWKLMRTMKADTEKRDE
jgi:hypothetical protein